MGNDLILFPLCKISSLHQPSKCLFSNLACTDISVGLSFRPFHRAYIISQEHCNLLPWLAHQPNLGDHFRWRVCPHTDCNKYRQTSVSLGLRYRQVATLAIKCNFSPLLACLYYKRNNKPFHRSYLFDNQ